MYKYTKYTHSHTHTYIHIKFSIHGLQMTSKDVQKHGTFGFQCTFLKRQHHFKPSGFKYVVQLMFISFTVHHRSWSKLRDRRKKPNTVPAPFIFFFFLLHYPRIILLFHCVFSFFFALFHTQFSLSPFSSSSFSFFL